MRYIKSCGAVVFTRQGNEILYVIIRQTNGDWGFPKGHTEQGETEQETALREIREEVGLRTELLPGFRKEITYPFPNKVACISKWCTFWQNMQRKRLRVSLGRWKRSCYYPIGRRWNDLPLKKRKISLRKQIAF